MVHPWINPLRCIISLLRSDYQLSQYFIIHNHRKELYTAPRVQTSNNNIILCTLIFNTCIFANSINISTATKHTYVYDSVSITHTSKWRHIYYMQALMLHKGEVLTLVAGKLEHLKHTKRHSFYSPSIHTYKHSHRYIS